MIQPGQVYRSCDPRESIRIRITAYRPGDARAHVVDAVTGKRFRQILVQQLHESPVTATGRRRRTGYVLDSQAPAGEAPEGPQERPGGGSAGIASSEPLTGAQVGADGLDPHNAGPTVAECAAQDRAYWTNKHAGEGQ